MHKFIFVREVYKWLGAKGKGQKAKGKGAIRK